MTRLAWIAVLCGVLSCAGCVKQGRVGTAYSDSLAASLQTKFLVETPKGEFLIALFDDTPLHKQNFIKLVQAGYYDDLVFHRVVPELIVQAGDPQFRSTPNPALDSLDRTTIPAEIKHSHFRGTVAAARKDDKENPERASSATQFYINLNDNRFYDGSYTVFGRVIEGMETVDKIAKVARDGRNVPYERIWLKIRPLGEK
ncbi:MAG: peptidylprolyl isomerase [Chloroherpetonaceae bacterium]|nr:peptidylprolyl isomerase [Chloroherpetonaceae bacterium]MCS7212060.1 peptidylprolyl isomerase [Chloroherpetonaceae bacterium]MDW8018517.1 peptidylprolyl isomerase [Chloroherpetonaceae bacterium]MDW8465622.1 peptidylprolyl isomerase [Chloroherpetonaceae bacterium]